MLKRLRTGLLGLEETEAQPTAITDGAKLVRRALLVYEGDFDSMDGPVTVSGDDLKLLAKNHNALIQTTAKLAGVGESDLNMKDFPPVQLDHSVSAKDTVGRLIGPISLEPYTTKDGKEVMGVFGNVCILGDENVQKVQDGRWTHLSVGVDFEKGKFSELTITPFPAAPEASLLAKFSERHFQIGQRMFSWEFDEQSKKIAVSDAAGQRILEAETLEKAKARLERDIKAGRLARLGSGTFDVRGKKFSWVDNEKTGEIDVFTAGGEPVCHVHSVAQAKDFVEYEMQIGRIQLREGDVMKDSEHMVEDKKEKMKKKMAEETAEQEKKESEEHEKAETPEEEAAEHEKMKKMSDEPDEDVAHMSDDEDKDDEEKKKLKKMKEDEEEEEKKLAEEHEKAQSAKLRSMREQIKKLSTDFRKTSEAARLAARRGSISTRLAKLRAEAKITPAEVKKIDITKLAKEADSTISAVLKTYEDREPVVMVGALGSIKAENLSTLSQSQRMSRLEMETRQNMTLLRNTIPKKLGSQSPDEVSIHIDTSPHLDVDSEHAELCKMLDEGKIEDVKQRMKSWMKKLQYGTSPSTMASAEETEKHLSTLAESAEKMQNQFNELQKLAGSLVGI